LDSPPNPPTGSTRLGLGRRLLSIPVALVRYARRRPRRALGYSLLLLILVGGALASGVWIWFAYHLRAARFELSRGHNAPALRHLDECRRLRAEDPEVLLLTARVARRSGNWDEAEGLLNRCLEVSGNTDDLVLERILLRATRGELEETAMALAARIQAGGPNAELAHEALVAGLLYRYDWAGALSHLNDWLAADPDSTTALLLRGKLEEQRLARVPAREYYQRVVERDPEHDEARLRLATLLLEDRRGTESLEHLAVLLKRLPDHPEIAVMWARALALQGRGGESRAALDACLQSHPEYPPALAERGAQALVDGDEVGAEQYLARAVSLDPGNLVTRSQYALALRRNGKRNDAARQEEAIETLKADFDRITVLITGPLRERPNDPNVHFEIAQIALRSGQLREALRWLTAALRVDPHHVPTHRVLADLYHQLNKPGLAAHHRALAQRASDSSPKP
jgi:predicted Zn-dependent protease